MRGDFLKKENGGINGPTFIVVLWKRVLKMQGKNSTQKNEKRKLVNLELKNALSKNSRSQRHSNYYSFVKSRVASWTCPGRKQRAKNTFFKRKGCPKAAFLKITKIVKGTKN